MANEEKEIAAAISSELGIQLGDVFSKEEIIDKLALKLAGVAEKGAETFFQLMYRLDIPERKLNQAMYDKDAIHEIAELVYNRQLQKARSREFYKRNKPKDDEELGW
ncbi:MAG: hypothetical protein BGO70_13175 [Bacteroidetes bacterium 43-93]|nr:hypothetical protein [Bacteroidota bacterium]OJW99389.1 MAG: hypothetical protein BGO70_13175 [Bacteroidetes bacterium 43-93]